MSPTLVSPAPHALAVVAQHGQAAAEAYFKGAMIQCVAHNSRCALTTQRLDGQFRQRDDKQAAIMIAAALRSRGGAPKKWLVRLDDATAKWAVPAARQFTSSGNDNCC